MSKRKVTETEEAIFRRGPAGTAVRRARERKELKLKKRADRKASRMAKRLSESEKQEKMDAAFEKLVYWGLEDLGFSYDGKKWTRQKKDDFYFIVSWKKGIIIGQVPNTQPYAVKLSKVKKKVVIWDKEAGQPRVSIGLIKKFLKKVEDATEERALAIRKIGEMKKEEDDDDGDFASFRYAMEKATGAR